MELSFENKEIRQICEDKNIALMQYGSSISEVLQNRLADLLAARSLSDIIIGEPAELSNSIFKINLISDQVVATTHNEYLRLRLVG